MGARERAARGRGDSMGRVACRGGPPPPALPPLHGGREPFLPRRQRCRMRWPAERTAPAARSAAGASFHPDRPVRCRYAVIQRPGRASPAPTQATAGPWDLAEEAAKRGRGSGDTIAAATASARTDASAHARFLPNREIACFGAHEILHHHLPPERGRTDRPSGQEGAPPPRTRTTARSARQSAATAGVGRGVGSMPRLRNRVPRISAAPVQNG